MASKFRLRAHLVLCLAAALPLLSGCLVTARSSQSRNGNYVSDATLNQIQPGQTAEAWVRATLGPPTVTDRVDADTQIWKYNYTDRKDTSNTVFVIFAGSDVKETAGTVFIEMRRGVVNRVWRG